MLGRAPAPSISQRLSRPVSAHQRRHRNTCARDATAIEFWELWPTLCRRRSARGPAAFVVKLCRSLAPRTFWSRREARLMKTRKSLNITPLRSGRYAYQPYCHCRLCMQTGKSGGPQRPYRKAGTAPALGRRVLRRENMYDRRRAVSRAVRAAAVGSDGATLQLYACDGTI